MSSVELQMIRKILDDAFDKMRTEKYVEVADKYDNFHRTPGMTMDTYI